MGVRGWGGWAGKGRMPCHRLPPRRYHLPPAVHPPSTASPLPPLPPPPLPPSGLADAAPFFESLYQAGRLRSFAGRAWEEHQATGPRNVTAFQMEVGGRAGGRAGGGLAANW